ncbi:MAG: hypothetical protein HY778_14345 [Betaproteobacteria bacterium]|nr:hypothetical protein [Betaproteobacteria bacterium]
MIAGWALTACAALPARADVVLIGNANVPKMDATTVARVYTGKTALVDGVEVRPIHAPAGSTTRHRFLRHYLGVDEESHLSYWTVRRYIGMGTPPAEMASVPELIRFVRATPGAVGYVDKGTLLPGLNVVCDP